MADNFNTLDTPSIYATSTSQLETLASLLTYGNMGIGSLLLLGADTQLSRVAANVIGTPDSLALTDAAAGLQLTEGTNARMGTLTLDGATPVTVSTTAVTADSRIFLTANTAGGTPAGVCWVSDRTAGESFAVTGVAGDTSTVAWLLVEPYSA